MAACSVCGLEDAAPCPACGEGWACPAHSHAHCGQCAAFRGKGQYL